MKLTEPRLPTGTDVRQLQVSLYDFLRRVVTSVNSLDDSLSGPVSATAFGAVGDGVTDDTSAIQAALDAGKRVYLPDGRFKITSGLVLSKNNQEIAGVGVLVPVGTFDAVTVNNAAYGCTVDLIMDCAGHTGYGVAINNANRTVVRRLVQLSGYDGIYVRKANWTVIDKWYADNLRGDYGIRWYGNATDRSDILAIVTATCSFASGVYGTALDWDGNCNSLTILYFGAVLGGYGLRVRNSSGGPPPLIARIHDLEVDFPKYDGVRIEAGYDIDILSLYSQGSDTGSGVYTGAAIPADLVRIMGGKSTGNARYGVENVNRIRLGNMDLSSGANTLGEISGNTVFAVQRLELGSDLYLGKDGSGNLLLVANATSYLGASAATGEWTLYSGGETTMRAGNSGGEPHIAFLGATPIPRPAVTGSRSGNAALASLLDQLEALGLITDSTTA